jgi:hypothetical protein
MMDKIKYKIIIIGMAQIKKSGILINEIRSKMYRYWLPLHLKFLNLSAIKGNSTIIKIENNTEIILRL